MVDARFDRAIAAIDAANAEDPNPVVVNGEERPKELAHGELMTAWVERFDPEASVDQLLAARAHHIRRWTLARADYPEGRAGYLRWRAELARRHADEASEILEECGYDRPLIERVEAIITKRGRTSDPAVQLHEDALCLVFLETQFGDLAARLGREKTIDVVAKTIAKMSNRGLEAAQSLGFSRRQRDLLEAAFAAAEQSS